MTKKERRKIKLQRARNRKLCKKYPWLAADYYVWSGKKIRGYKYDWTWLDDLSTGWRKSFGLMMIKEMDEELKASGRLTNQNDPFKRWMIQQIKEKYGEMRFYHSGASRKFEEIVNKYSIISANVCELCGKPDVKILNTGWIMPVCYKCYRKNWIRRNPNSTEEKIQIAYAKETEGSTDKISDTYSYSRYNPDGQKQEYVFDISETVQKIRIRWEKYDRKRSNRTSV
jgi:hypothetical protein